MAKAGWQCAIRKSGPSTSTSSEAFTSLGGDEFQITSAAKRMIDISQPWHLRDNAGTVPFASVTAADFAFGEFTVSGVAGALTFYGNYLPLTTASELFAEAKSFSISESVELLDTTVFTSTSNYRKRIAGLEDYSLSVDMNLNARDMERLTALKDGTAICGVEINSGASPLFRGYGRIANIERSGSVDGLVEATVEWQVTADRHAETGLFAGPSERLLNS